tara:strand:+ start:1 stop:696 length:696 start_codon:yes stop_codon:yes gene_type:complete
MSIGVDVNNEEEVFKNFINAQNFINQEREKVKFFKTHSSLCKMYDSNFTDLKNTLGSIYIVRDPRNVVTSLAHHYGLSVDQATNVMIDKDRLMDKTVKNCRVFLGSWGFNYNSWKNLQNQKKYLLVKYEDLLKKKKTVLLKIFKYLDSLGLKSSLDMIKLNKVIKTTEFESMKKKEENETFYEAVIDTNTGKRKNFFNLGPQNNWRKLLDKKNVDKIEISFEKEMLELGYL